MALKKSEIYGTLVKCANKLRSNSGIGAESFKNYVLILLFLKYISDRKKSGETTGLEIPDGCSFDDIATFKSNGKEKGKDKAESLGDKINKSITAIAEKNGLEDIINITDHDFCDKKLGSPEESNKLIKELVAAFQVEGLDFSKNRAADDDLIGDAYEYLMRNFASLAGKDKGQFYTPTEVSRLMACLIGIDVDERPKISAYDPTCGSASLLLRVKAAAKHTVSLFGQDIDPANLELSHLNAFIHGCNTPDIRLGDTLNSPKHVDNGELRTFDYIVSNPKFSLHNWMNGALENDIYGRWNSEIGVPPQQYGDFAFLLHCIKSLNHDGKCAIILPNGVLTRGGSEAKLRKWIIEQKLLSGVIAFPQNAFFGTTIAGNVLIIDKKHKQDGVFFIDASDLGYKDDDSKIRLREQDIKRITDVWRERKDVPHFAHLSSYERKKLDGETVAKYEIERNDFALNLSLYVVPVDKEVHQNIDAHLHGGLPESDIERMQNYWDICPTLKNDLFKPQRDGYEELGIDKKDILQTIENNDSFCKQAKKFTTSLVQWCNEIKPEMYSVAKGNDPKSIIASWGQSLLEKFKKCKSLVGAYDVYDQLMNYYKDSMQDDLYMISNGGWETSLNIPTKKTVKWSDLSCDLLPVNVAIDYFLSDLKGDLEKEEAELASLQEKMEDFKEDNEENFVESDFFFGKLNETNLKKALKGTCSKEQHDLWNEYLSLMQEERLLKNNVKKTSSQLLKEIIRVYAEIKNDEETTKKIIIENKWLKDISNLISNEMQKVTESISAETTNLTNRYEYTMKNLLDDFTKKERAVGSYLKKMGFEL